MLNRSIFRTLSAGVLAGLLLTGCDKSGQNNAASHQMPPPEVDVVTLHSQPVSLTTELSGRTSAYRVAEVRPQVTGIILKRLFTEGSNVKAGQVLYRIDPAIYQAAVASAKAALEKAQVAESNARQKAERYEALRKRQMVSSQDLDDARADWKQQQAAVAVAKAGLQRARIDLAYTEIKAPIAGRIGRSAVTEGALVTAEQATALARIQQLDPLYVDLRQSTADLLRLKRAFAAGQLVESADRKAQVKLQLEDGSDYPLPGLLQFSDATVDESTGMVNLRAEIPNPNHLLLPGMFVKGRLVEGERPNGLLVPQVSVTRTPTGGATVLLVGKDSKVERRDIEIGRTIDGDWLVESGLKDGDRVIVAGIQKVSPGMTVKANEKTSDVSVSQSDASRSAQARTAE